MAGELDTAFRTTAAGLNENPAVRIEQVDGQSALILTPLSALLDAPSLRLLQTQVEARLPDIDIAELLLEMNAWTGCLDEIVRADGKEPSRGLTLSLCAVLVAQACNIGLKAVMRPDHPDLNLGRLSWVQQNYLRADTLVRANAKLVDAQLDLPLAGRWGGGDVASADGLRFVVPVKTMNAGFNRKYFGAQRGITYYTFVSDQFTAFLV